MDTQKLIIESDGEQTRILIDGVLIGQGIRKLEFSTENLEGEMRPTIRLLEVDVRNFKVERIDRTCGNKCGHGATV